MLQFSLGFALSACSFVNSAKGCWYIKVCVLMILSEYHRVVIVH